MDIFEQMESEVRSYSRAFPAVFARGEGAYLYDEDGRMFLDFFCGAGVLNYGHDNPLMRRALLDYIGSGGIIHSLDMATVAKREFIRRFRDIVLRPRHLDYKMQFTGPTGTNAIEAALKLARKVKGRPTVVAFDNAFHGMTLGALAATTNSGHRRAAGVPLGHVIHIPYDDGGNGGDSLSQLEDILESRCGIDEPAAIIVETVQAEGGVNPSSFAWLRRIEDLARAHDLLLIVDDIQVGCGRTGPFFSFEPADINPDIICLSKALSGYGLPLAVVLIKPDLDIWLPGEHNATFRGNNLAFVTATSALDYWKESGLTDRTNFLSRCAMARLLEIAESYPDLCMAPRGRGLILGLPFHEAHTGRLASNEAFRRGLIAEAAGHDERVLKILPPLLISEQELKRGLDIIADSVAAISAIGRDDRH